MDVLKNCFKKHSFNYLNDIDYNMLNNVLKDYFKNNDSLSSGVYFDVGTNAGSFVRVLKDNNIVDNIHCFEPHPILSQEVVRVYPFVIMNTICLSNTDDDSTVFLPEHSVALGSLIRRPVFNDLSKEGQQIVELKTRCKTIDSYCLENNISFINFLKIDVEGAEKMIFDGAKRMFSENRIQAGIFEVGATLIDAGTSEDELISLISSYGFNYTKSFSKSNIYFYKTK